MKNRAVLLTDGLLATADAKTAHGLIRGSERYKIVGVVDRVSAGQDAGSVLDGRFRHIPVFSGVTDALKQLGSVDFAIVAIATNGGILPETMLETVKISITNGLSIVNGLHELLSDKPEIVTLAAQYGGDLIDVRRLKPRKELHFWTGEVREITAPVIAVMGTDCALGKRTTARLIREACEQENISAQMIYTGQTGWLQGGKYGFIFDSTLNDFVGGELEHALVSCWKETNPDVLLIEGQAALRNPSGPCGSEFLISGNARHVVLVHAPKRQYYDFHPAWGAISSVESEIALIRAYGSEVIALAINTEDCTEEEAIAFQQSYTELLGIPVLLPLQQGVTPVIPIIRSLIAHQHAN